MIFDEPTNGLDIMTARTITAFIRECRDNGKTVIFSTHIMSEVEKPVTPSASSNPANSLWKATLDSSVTDTPSTNSKNLR